MIRLAMEVPFAHLWDFVEDTDFDFALAHIALEQGKDSDYCKFYREMSENGREVWLDNSTHELGESLSLDKLKGAIDLVWPTHIVVPEVRFNHARTLVKAIQAVETLKKEYPSLKFVVCHYGTNKELAEVIDEFDMVAVPFDSKGPRDLVVKGFNKRVHYFGFRNFRELIVIPPYSIDTSIPIRAVQHFIDIRQTQRRPKLPLLDFKLVLSKRQVLGVKDACRAIRYADENIE